MATTATFATMLKRYMPTQLLVEEMKSRDYFFKTVKKDQNWFGGRYEVPFESGEASTVVLGELASSSDIAETGTVLGYEDNYREIWGSMVFNEKDLDLQKGGAASFLKLYKPKFNQFMEYMRAQFSHQLLLGSKIDTLTSDGTALGVAAVSFPERFVIGQKCVIRNDDPAAENVYVISIDRGANTITVSDSRGGSAYDISAYTTAKSSALYMDGSVNTSTGAFQNGFNNLKDILLSNANGGGASVHNQTKASYPFLQALNKDGSSISDSNILDEMFDFAVEVQRFGIGGMKEYLISYKHFGSISKVLEVDRRFVTSDKAAGYGFNSVVITGPAMAIKVTALRDLNDSEMMLVDWNSMVLAGSHFFDKKRHGTGDEFYYTRATTGYKYIVDVRLYGNLIVHNP